jgi:thioredoxin reductase (NADPH)
VQKIERLAAYGERRMVREGDVLYREGDPTYDFFVILSGMVAIVEGYGGADERLIGMHGPHRFLGELSMITGQVSFLTAVVREPGEVLAVPVDRVRAMVAENPSIGDLILRAFLLRRSILIEKGAGLRIIGSRYSDDARRLRDFAARNRMPYRWIDLESDAQAETLLRHLGVPPHETPVVIWHGTQVLRNPSNAKLARLLGLAEPAEAVTDVDLVVVGAGPAGLAAAVYAASEGLSAVIVDSVATGGQAGTSSRIENYLGFPSGISGGELAERAVLQARKFGARVVVPLTATALSGHDGHYVIRLDDGTQMSCRMVLIATGARYRKLDVPRLADFEMTSVYYAATLPEAQACERNPVAVVGGGNSAGQATIFLAERAPHVHLLVRHDALGRDMSRYLADRIMQLNNVTVHLNTEVRELVGEHALDAVIVADNRTEVRRRIDARALFVFVGAEPCTAWLGSEVALDDDGFILTGADAGRAETGQDDGEQPFLLETSRLGVFAAGDVRSGSTKRVASAVGEGAMVIQIMHEHLQRYRELTASTQVI